MRKDSAIILGVSVLITAGIIGAAHVYSGREASLPSQMENPTYSAPAGDFSQAEYEPPFSRMYVSLKVCTSAETDV